MADQIPQDMRNMAEQSVAKAREAVEKVMQESSRLYQQADSSMQAAQAGARGMGEKAATYAQANIKAAFDFAQQLVRAKDLQEVAQLQQSFVQSQMQQLNQQMQDIGGAVADAAKTAMPKR